MSEAVQHRCPNCGGSIADISEERLKCKYCGSTFENQSFKRHTESLKTLLDMAKLEYVNNQRRNLYDAVHAKYISAAEVRQYAIEIKKLLPDDFQANFYLLALSSDVKEINRAIRRIQVDDNYDSLPAVIHFLIASLQVEYLLELNNLIERAYKKRDLQLYARFATEISEEAEKVSEGIYTTEVPRDVFIAYSSKDMEQVSELCEELEAQGISCFVAARNLRHGAGAVENYDSALKAAMDNCRCFVFVSGVNSRSLSCDAVTKEIPYIRNCDIANAPAHLRNNYSAIPNIYKKPRIEYRIGNEKSSDAVSRITDAFFEGHEWAYTPADVAVRVVKMLYEEQPAEAPITEMTPPPAPLQTTPKKKSKAPLIAVASVLLAGAVTVGALVVPGLAGAEARDPATDSPSTEDQAESDNKHSPSSQTTTQSGTNGNTTPGYQMTQTPSANPSTDESNTNVFEFSSNGNGTCYVTGLEKCTNTNLVIPAVSPDGDQVIGIKKQAFWHKSVLTSVTIPEGVTTIEESAFEHCVNITSLTLPDSLTSIGRSAFRDLEKMTHLTLPDSLTEIGEYAFYNCDALTAVIIPKSVTAIGEYAFYRCRSLQSLTISDGVTSIGANAFQDCLALTSVTIPGTTLIIGPNAFENCEKLKTVTIAEGVVSISDKAFYDCTALTSVFIPSTVSTIGSQVFYNCKNITGFTVDRGNTRYQFVNNCLIDTSSQILLAGFQKAKISSDLNVTKIEAYAFYGISNLQSMDIPKRVTHIGEYAFYGCNYTGSLTISESLQSIGQDALASNCFTSITVDPNNTFYKGGENCLVEVNTKRLLAVANTTGTVVIPDGSVTQIPASAFEGSKNITSITIPEGITAIEASTFANCTNLQEVYLPDSVTTIGANAFTSCTKLSSVHWPAGLLRIEEKAFYKCSSLLSVNIEGSLDYIGEYAFAACSKLTNVSLPNTVTQIEDGAFNGCNQLTTFKLPDQLQYWGDSVLLPCYELTSITGGNADSKYRAIENCIIDVNTKTLVLGCKESKIPADGSVTCIGTKAFYGKSTMLSITIPNTVTQIKSYAFKNCGLLSVVIPEGVMQIDDGAFSSCTNLKTVYLPTSLKLLNRTTFQYLDTVIQDIYYAGTEEQWKTLITDNSFEVPRTATVHYNSPPQ